MLKKPKLTLELKGILSKRMMKFTGDGTKKMSALKPAFEVSMATLFVGFTMASMWNLTYLPCHAQSILPARQDAAGGGNPFEGLGRPDDPNPSRIGQYAQATPQSTPAELQALSPNDPTAPPPPPPLDSSAASIQPAPLSTDPNTAQTNPLGGLGLPAGLGLPGLGQPGASGQPNALPGVINSLGAGQVPQGTVFGTTNDPGLLTSPDGLTPPPPPISAVSAPPAPVEHTPMRQALGLTNLRRYTDSIAKLKELEAKQPNDPQVHYLLGVNYVLTRRYAEARSEYQLVERLAKGTPLAERAAEGLRKISQR